MSIRLDSNSEYLGRTSGLTGYNSAYTVAFWVKRKATVSYGHMWAASASTTQVSGNYVNSDFAGFTSDGTGWRVSAYVGGSTAGDGGSGTCTLDTWYHVAIVRESATALKLYVNGVQSGATCTTDVSSRSAVGGEWIGNFHGTYNADIEIAGFKSWSRALTATEINNEAGQYLPVDSAALVSCSPFTVVSGSPADVAEALTAQNGTAFSATGSVTLGATEPSGVVWGGVSVSGQTLTATASLIAGAVTGAAAVSGQTLTATTSLLAGGASAAGPVSVAGQTLTIAASLIAGAVTGAAAVAGQTLTASASLVVGAATGAASVAGQVLTATGSLIAGTVAGAASVSGQVLTATTSLIAGAVSGGTVTVAGQILTATATLISGMGGAAAGLWGRLWRGSLWSGGVFRG